MDVDSEVEPTLQEMAKRIAVVRHELLPALQELDEDAIVSFYSVDEQARLYLSAAFTLALSLYALDKITHRQPPAGVNTAAPRLTGAGTRSTTANSAAVAAPGSADTQLVLKIERITEYIKKLQELATLERQKKMAAAAQTEESMKQSSKERVGKRAREEAEEAKPSTGPAGAAAERATVKAMAETTRSSAAKDEEDYGDAAMFSVVSRVAGETGTLVSRLLKQVQAAKPE